MRSSQKRRVVVEKPLGTNLETSNDINDSLAQGFQEHQIYRIDHYLGKEAVQNLLALRFGNTIFERSWSNAAIDHVQITVAEDLGVEGRGDYYDDTGALRDMVQNHLLQILCLITMEPPVSISSESVRDEKLKVLKSLQSFNKDNIKIDSVRAQYTDGISKGKTACSYNDEEGVDSLKNTETFVALKVAINNWNINRSKTLIIVDGEEDLAPILLHLLAPLNTAILYGQPNRGVVLRITGLDSKSRCQSLINLFEEK